MMTTDSLKPVAATSFATSPRAVEGPPSSPRRARDGHRRFAATTSRDAVTCLHEEGHVDAKRMKLTLSGFAIVRRCASASSATRAFATSATSTR